MNDTPEPSDDEAKAANLRHIDYYLSGLRETHARKDSELPADFGHSLAKKLMGVQNFIAGIAKTPEPYLAKIAFHLANHGSEVSPETLAKVVTLMVVVGNKHSDAESITADLSGDIGYICDLLGIPQHGI